MTIFAEIAPDSGETTIRLAAGAILDGADQAGLTGGPWSLAELRLDEADIDWLLAWVRGAQGAFLRRCLDSWHDAGVSGHQLHLQAATGLLCMGLFAEVGRRHASDGWLWGRVVARVFPDGPPEALFVNGQPSHLLKEALETASRSAGLRHVFGVEGVQNWFRSVHLQFGFTASGFKQRLPEWLSGQVSPVGVQTLRGSRDLRSRTFCELWDALLDYRWANAAHGKAKKSALVGQDKCRAALVGSPWVLAEWVDDLLHCALKRIELGTSQGAHTMDAPPPEFLAAPRLSWDAQAPPVFVTRVGNVEGFDLDGSSYRVRAGIETLAELLLQPDGLYHVEPAGDIRLGAAHPVAHAELVDSGGVVQHITDLELWDPTEDVTIFRLNSGLREKDPYEGLPASGSYALLCPSDLEIVPPPIRWARVSNGKFTLAQIPDDWRELGVAVMLEGEDLWRARGKSDKRPSLPSWASDVHVERRQARVRLGEALELEITHPEGVSVCFVRVDGRSRNIETLSPTVVSLEPLVLDGDRPGGRLKLTIGVRYGDSRLAIRTEVHVPVEGAAMRDIDGWRPLDRGAELDALTARTNVFRVVPRHEDVDQTWRGWGLLEGATFVRRLSAYPGPIEGLAGLGGQLRVRYGPYNSAWPPMDVAASVVNRGRVRGFSAEDDGDHFTMLIDGHIEPDLDAHGVLWCDADAGLLRTKPVWFEVRGHESTTAWICRRPDGATSPWAVGVEYRGERIGAWWDQEWPRAVLEVESISAAELAAVIRWLRVPILAPIARASMLTMVSDYPRAIAEAWIRSDHLPKGLRHAEMDDAWNTAVRDLLDVGDGSAPWLCSVFDAFVDDGQVSPEVFDRAARGLMRVNPLLMGRVLFAAAAKYLLPTLGKPGAAGVLRSLVCRLAGCSGAADEEDVTRAVEELTLQVAFDVGIGQPADLSFVKQGLVDRALLRASGKRSGSDTDELNINLAMGIDPYRRLLAICMLRDKILPCFAG